MKRKALSWLLALCLIVGLLPTAALAAEEDVGGDTPAVCAESEGSTGDDTTVIDPGQEEPVQEPTAKEQLAEMIEDLPDPSEINPQDEEQVKTIHNQISAIYAFAEANGLGDRETGLLDEAADAIVNAVIAAAWPAEPLEDPTTESDMSGNCGATDEDSVTWALTKNSDESTYTLTISGTGAMADYTDPTKPDAKGATIAPWYSALTPDTETGAVPITQIVVGDQITGLGDYAFAYTSVEKAEFKANVTDYGDALYYCCQDLITVDWDNFYPKAISDGWVTEREQAGPYVPFSFFDRCEKLTVCTIGETTYADGTLVLPKNISAICTAAFRGTGFSTIDFLMD